MYLDRMNKKSEAVKVYIEETLARKLRMPITVDDTTVRAIALSNMQLEEGATICLNGEQVKVSDLQLTLKLVYPSAHMSEF